MWCVRWENGDEILRCHAEERAWEYAKRAAEIQRAEAILYADHGEVRLRADFRDDP